MSFATARPARDPLPSPGPVRASERLAILRARRPKLTLEHKGLKADKRAKDLAAARAALLEKYGLEFWSAKQRKLEVRKSLATFVKDAWHILEPGNELVWNWHIDVICDALEKVTRGEITRLLINIPPGHMKSWLVSVAWPAWAWLENPGWRSLFASYGQKLSDELSSNCRRLIESDWYKAQIPAVYGDKWDRPWLMASDANRVQVYKTELNGSRRSTSCSLSAAGTGFRGDCVVIDDPTNVSERLTPEALDGVISWYDKRMSSRFNDMRTGRIVIIMQRVHEHDLAGHVLEQDRVNANNPNWIPFEHICLRSEYDPDRPCKYDQRTERGELLFPAKFPKSEIEIAKIKLGGQFPAQHDQDPIPAGGGIIPMACLRFWYPADLKGNQIPAPHLEKLPDGTPVACMQGALPATFVREAQSWDCTFKDTSTSDFVAGQHWAQGAVPRSTDLFLLEGLKKRMGLSATIQAIREMRARHPRTTATYIEDKANGPAVMETLKQEIFALVPVNPQRGKEERAWAVEPAIRAGNVWLPHPALFPWVHDLLAELRAFPKGVHDDQVDAFTQALTQLSASHISVLQKMTSM